MINLIAGLEMLVAERDLERRPNDVVSLHEPAFVGGIGPAFARRRIRDRDRGWLGEAQELDAQVRPERQDTDRQQRVAFDDMTPVGKTRSVHVPRAGVRNIMVIVDTTNTKPGASGRVWIKRMSLER